MIKIDVQPNIIPLREVTEATIFFINVEDEPCTELYFAFKSPPEGIFLFGDRPVKIDLLLGHDNYSKRIRLFAEKPGVYTLRSRRFNYYAGDGKLEQTTCDILLTVVQNTQQQIKEEKTKWEANIIRETDKKKDLEILKQIIKKKK